MGDLFQIILYFHITGGALALLAAPIAMSVWKGNRVHRIAGKIFFWGMTIVFCTAVYLSIAHHIPFLFLIAFFSYQMVVSGYRSLYYKKLNKGGPVKTLDWIIVYVALVMNFILLASGIYVLIANHDKTGILSLIFGFIGLQFALRDRKRFRNGIIDKFSWLYMHIGGMIGGFIAAVTAFLVVNLSDNLPPLLIWLTPTVIGTPLISWFIYSYRKKFQSGKKLNEVVTARIGIKELEEQ